MVDIHPTAIVDHKAQLADSVKVGPYCVVGPQVSIEAGTELKSHVVIEGRTAIGENNIFFPFSAIGGVPQDKKYHGEDSQLIIGNGNTIRENCTINIGTESGGGLTWVGDDNWIMAYVHIAHDCRIGSHIILANNTSLAGHVVVKDWALTGGYTLVLQFCQLGEHSMTAFGARVDKDVPPYVMAAGYKLRPAGLNLIGLKRRGFSEEQITNIKKAYQLLYRGGLSLKEAKEKISDLAAHRPELQVFIPFFVQSQRPVVR